MLLRQMRYFMEVVDRGSFTQAAEACFISQSAISQQIKALEEELGAQLLLREGRRFSLTPAGEYFYRQGKVVLEELDRVCRETHHRASRTERLLRVAYPGNYAGQELHRAVAAFSARYPGAVVQTVSGTHEELYDLLRFDGADLVINDQRRAFSQVYVNLHLAYCPCFVEVSAQGGLAQRTSLSLQEAWGYPCVLVASPGQQEHEKGYYRDTLGFGSRYLFAPTLEEARLLVSGNRGIFPLEGGGDGEEGTIRRLPLTRDGEQIRRRYCAFWRKDNGNQDLPLFGEILREQFLLSFPEETVQS